MGIRSIYSDEMHILSNMVLRGEMRMPRTSMPPKDVDDLIFDELDGGPSDR